MVVGKESRIVEEMINTLVRHPSVSTMGLENMEAFLFRRNQKMCCFLGDNYIKRIAVSINEHEFN